MKRIAYLLVGLMAVSFGCDRDRLPKGTPQCVRDEIEKIKQAPVWNPPLKVYSYLYKGQTVYYIPVYQCCDFASQLVDENCNVVCSPDGGLSGRGDGRCPDFTATRSNEKLVWQDTRKP